MSDDAATYVGQLSPDRQWRWDGNAWQPAVAQWSSPPWANLRLRRAATWSAVVGVLVTGLLADQSLRSGAVGLGACLALACAALVLVFVGRLERLEARVAAAGAVAFAAWLAIRASPWLVWPDVAAALLLLGFASSIAVRGSWFDLGIAEWAARGIHAALHGLGGSAFVIRPVTQTRTRLSAVAPFARGLLIAAPIAVLVAGLLASADPVFASLLKIDIDFSRLLLDAFYVLTGSLVAAGLLRLAVAEPLDRVDGPGWRLGAVEGLTVLAVLDVIFGAFAVAQAIAAAGAAGDTLRAAGITYSDYARNGFFQLLWVAGITLVVLVAFTRMTRFFDRTSRMSFLALAQIAIALTLLIVAVAFMRLSLYESAYGFTMLRLYSHLFAGWIAVVYLLLAADLAGVFRQRRWFVGASGATALALLMALNFANPETLVVGLNTDRAASTHKVDADYLRELSSDATPALLDARSRLDPALRPSLTRAVCGGSQRYAPGWAAYNWADAQAADARRHGC